LVIKLIENRSGLSVKYVKETYGFDDRTYRNYRQRLQQVPELVDKKGNPLVIEVKNGDDRYLKLKELDISEDDIYSSFATFYMASALMGFLRGTNLYQPMEHWAKELKHQGALISLSNMEKKLYSIREHPKDYSEKTDLIRKVVMGVIQQRRMIILYHAANVDTISEHADFKPYTLVHYRYGLYLIGQSEARGKKIIILAIDRMIDIQLQKNGFHYPTDYSPARYFSGAFGIYRGDGDQRIELIFSKGVARQVKERQIHATAKYMDLKDGSLKLTMTVSSTAEVLWWVLSFGANVKVIHPKELRDEVKKQVATLSEIYK
jgi:hypothetical protein